jgi:hypothetical protein
MITPPPLSHERANVITATDSTILMGTVPPEWGTPETVWMDKMGLATDKAESIAMLLGHVFEPIIIASHLESLGGGWSSTSPGFKRMPDAPFGCTPDALISDAIGAVNYHLECKSTTSSDDWGPSGTEEVPDRVYIQVQHSMMVTDTPYWAVRMLLYRREDRERIACRVMRGEPLDAAFLAEVVKEQRTYTIMRNESIIGDIRSVGQDFWDRNVATRTRPSNGAMPSADVRPRVDSITRVSDADVDALLGQLAAARAAATAATKDADATAARVRALLSERGLTGIATDRFTVTSQSSQRTTIDYESAFQSACKIGELSPETRAFILAQYVTRSQSTPRLTIKENQ